MGSKDFTIGIFNQNPRSYQKSGVGIEVAKNPSESEKYVHVCIYTQYDHFLSICLATSEIMFALVYFIPKIYMTIIKVAGISWCIHSLFITVIGVYLTSSMYTCPNLRP